MNISKDRSIKNVILLCTEDKDFHATMVIFEAWYCVNEIESIEDKMLKLNLLLPSEILPTLSGKAREVLSQLGEGVIGLTRGQLSPIQENMLIIPKEFIEALARLELQS
jgi:hypothetical protein